jgi:nucleoside-diphosphate-sugar epimerase
MTERVLITGGAGYIGSLLAPMLLAKGYEVTIFDTFMYGADPVLMLASNPRVRFIKGDIRNKEEVAAAVKGQDWVFHLAAIVGYPACAADPIRANTVNIDGTRNVVDAMVGSQRLVFASTGSTYGKVEKIASEDTPIAPLTLYGRTKSAGEDIVRQANVDWVILRFATVFGISPRMRLDLIVNDFVHQAVHNKLIILFEGHYRRTFLHSIDASNSYLFTMDHFDAMRRCTFNVGDEKMNCTKREIANKIHEFIDYYLHEASTGTDLDQRNYEVDYSKIRSLGYESHVSMEDGITELVKIMHVLHIPSPMRNV